MNNDYIVSWFDNEGNEWLGEWTDYETALNLFKGISGIGNEVDPKQVKCELWSDAHNKVLMRYDNIENKYYSC